LPARRLGFEQFGDVARGAVQAVFDAAVQDALRGQRLAAADTVFFQQDGVIAQGDGAPQRP
jgi:hypothetical protein